MKTLAQEDSNIFEEVTASDIAWGVTTYINNKEYWDMLIREEDGVGNAGSNDKGDSSSPEGEKEVEDAGIQEGGSRRAQAESPSLRRSPRKNPPGTPVQERRHYSRRAASPRKETPEPIVAEKTNGRKKRKKVTGSSGKKKKAAEKSPEESPGKEYEGSVGEDPSESPRKRGGSAVGRRWTKNKRTKLNNDGWAREGKLFYERVRLSIRGIDMSDWKVVWDRFWHVERASKLSQKQMRMLETGSDEEELDNEDEEERAHMFSDNEGEMDIY